MLKNYSLVSGSDWLSEGNVRHGEYDFANDFGFSHALPYCATVTRWIGLVPRCSEYGTVQIHFWLMDYKTA